MGNCQAVDNATLLIQHPSGRVHKLYSPLSASLLLKSHPGHHVALLLTTTVYNSSSSSAAPPLRVTRIKLLRPTDTLHLGHVYRLLTSQEVMKGVMARKQAKMAAQLQPKIGEKDQGSERARRSGTPLKKSRIWQPALKSISESAT